MCKMNDTISPKDMGANGVWIMSVSSERNFNEIKQKEQKSFHLTMNFYAV